VGDPALESRASRESFIEVDGVFVARELGEIPHHLIGHLHLQTCLVAYLEFHREIFAGKGKNDKL
jgi:hypothetical protein